MSPSYRLPIHLPVPLLAAFVLLLAPQGAWGARVVLQTATAAPSVRVDVPERAQGWAGIFYEGDPEGLPRLRSMGPMGSVIRVLDVAQASPAFRAGLRPGDLITAINGRAVSPDGFRSLNLREGDRLQLRLVRGGDQFEAIVTATRLPERPVASSFAADARDHRIDSVRTRIMGEIDSILVQGAGEARSFSVVVTGAPDHVIIRRQAGAPSGGVAEDRGLPFHTFVLRSREEADALTREAEALRGVMAGLRARTEVEREAAERLLETARVRQLQEGTRQYPVASSGSGAGGGPRAVQGVAVRAAAPPPPPAGVAVRPLTPYILGQRVVAGAELSPLNPELAEYFQGEEGLLVLQVLDGSPARDAGVLAGDIVTRVGTRRVRTLDEVRSALEAVGSGAVQLTLVRKGRTVLLTLPR